MTYHVSLICYSVHLDNVERVAMLLKMNAANSVNAISMSGHQFAMSHAASTLNEMSRLSEVRNFVFFRWLNTRKTHY